MNRCLRTIEIMLTSSASIFLAFSITIYFRDLLQKRKQSGTKEKKISPQFGILPSFRNSLLFSTESLSFNLSRDFCTLNKTFKLAGCVLPNNAIICQTSETLHAFALSRRSQTCLVRDRKRKEKGSATWICCRCGTRPDTPQARE